MQAGMWPNPPHADEYAVRFDHRRGTRVLVIPALFDEANKLRHFTVEMMRKLDAAGVDSMLPDLPGTNESLAPLAEQSLDSWRAAMTSAAQVFGATHCLTVRGGALCAPDSVPVLHYAPMAGASLLRGMIRARVLADREAGHETSSEVLKAEGAQSGLQLAGYQLGADMFRQLSASTVTKSDIAQNELGGPGLWLRAEPDHDPAQAEKLAQLVVERLS